MTHVDCPDIDNPNHPRTNGTVTFAHVFEYYRSTIICPLAKPLEQSTSTPSATAVPNTNAPPEAHLLKQFHQIPPPALLNFEHQPDLPEFMKQILLQMTTMNNTNSTISRCTPIHHTSSGTIPRPQKSSNDSNPWSNTLQVNDFRTNLPSNTPSKAHQRTQAAARTFFPLSPTHGFQYVYLNSNKRIRTKKLRSKFRRLGITSSRLLDIHYPTRKSSHSSFTMSISTTSTFTQSLTSTLLTLCISRAPTTLPIHQKNVLTPPTRSYLNVQSGPSATSDLPFALL
ncbi:unnamed protein product [Absidia cylindrospora]